MFQPTRPRRARPGHTSLPVTPDCFNPRAHEGRDFELVVDVGELVLFQPTRPRRARLPSPLFQRPMVVSTHAPTKGATVMAALPLSALMFQPTRPRRARRLALCELISKSSFNPRAHEGRDAMVLIKETSDVFQPTRPRRARPTRYRTRRARSGSFNPRAHEGRDPSSLNNFAQMPVSTHAPTKGATQTVPDTKDGDMVSTHAPTKGATILMGGHPEILAVSTHAPTKGATFSTRQRKPRLSFNPRAHEGRDYSSRASQYNTMFQPTRPRRARPV